MKRVTAIALAATIAALLTMTLLSRPRRTSFGEIKGARMAEPHLPNPIQRAIDQAAETLHFPAMRTRPSPRDLTIGGKQMHWSLMSPRNKTGWLYFAKPYSNDPFWEFAPCSRSNLTELIQADLKTDFVHQGETNRIRSAFDASRWEKLTRQTLNGRAIPVKEGQIVIARLLDSPSKMYAISFIDQGGADNWGTITVDYVGVDSKQAEQTMRSSQ